jgi:hypothetical protein
VAAEGVLAAVNKGRARKHRLGKFQPGSRRTGRLRIVSRRTASRRHKVSISKGKANISVAEISK